MLRSSVCAAALVSLAVLITQEVRAETVGCPIDADYVAEELALEVHAKRQTAAENLAKLDALAVTCSRWVQVQGRAASGWLNHAYGGGLGMDDTYQALDKAWGYILTTDAMDTNHVYAEGLYQMKLSALRGLIKLSEDENGRTHPLLTGQQKVPHCLNRTTNITQNIWYDFDRKWGPDGAVTLMYALAEACRADDEFLNRGAFGYIAEYHLEAAKRAYEAGDFDNALVETGKAKSAVKAYFRDDRTSGISWSSDLNSELIHLADAYAFEAFLADPSEKAERWFAPDAIGQSETVREIGLMLDWAWSQRAIKPNPDDPKKSLYGTRLSAYRRVISVLMPYATATGAPGRQMLYDAAIGHTNGIYAERSDLEWNVPPEMMYSWIEPK